MASDDTIRWELSPDGEHWTEYARDRRRFEVKRVKMEIYGGTHIPVANPGVALFSRLTLTRDSAPPDAVSTRAVITDGGLLK